MEDQFKEQFHDLSGSKYFKEITHEVIEVCDARILSLIEEDLKRDVLLSCILHVIRSTRKSMLYYYTEIGCQSQSLMHEQFKQLEAVEESTSFDFDDLSEKLVWETGSICKIVSLLELRFREHEEIRIKEKRELESSILSLTEENREISGLLKIAIMEKERSKGKGVNGDDNRRARAAILQIAEKGLQKVGFGFVMGVLSGGDNVNAQPVDQSSDIATSDGDGDGEEEVASLVVTVEHIMKNLRTEINDLRRSLNQSRLNCEQLQALANDQAVKLKEKEQHIKDVEERENLLSNRVEELTGEITVAGEEIARWREACELEVEAAKAAIKEREKEILQLKYEVERTKSALERSNKKVELKERVASRAMAAQVAAETCVRLADRRSVGLRDRIEELTRELETNEEGRRHDGACRRIRHLCWPWQGYRFFPAVTAANWRPIGNRRRSLPEIWRRSYGSGSEF